MSKKRWKIGLVVTLGAAMTFSAGLPAAEMTKTYAAADRAFTDVHDTYWAKPEIDFLSSRDIISGYADNSFGIRNPINRAEAAVLIMRALGWGDLSGNPDPGYPDIAPNHWAYNAIAAMKNAGFFAPEGDYKPRQNLTRAEMADILVKTFDLRSTSGVRFTDVPRDHWAYDSIQILAGSRVTVGYEDGTFRPENPVTRTEFAVFTARVLDETFLPKPPQGMEGVQTIYDIEIGDQFYQLHQPLMLTNTWMVPIELFEKMGYLVETVSPDKVLITTTEGLQFHVEAGNKEVWVGSTLVNVTKGVETINGQTYIEGSNILRTLQKPLVYYPEQRFIRISSPSVTVADIKQKAPEAILDLIHDESPYWQWTKKDSDYLEFMRRNGSLNEQSLLQEMALLSEAFFNVEQEKVVVKGLNYYSDHVTGKLDAITRGLSARYTLVYEPDQYKGYPAVGKSGAAGSWRFDPGTEFAYTVSDHAFEHFEENKHALIGFIQSNDAIHFEALQGLNIHGIPFSIREVYADGSAEAFAGKAMGDSQMIVTNSNLGTFVHEFGHNWDAKFGDEKAYLALRGKSNYTPPSNAWEDRVGENFAEDFVAAFLPDDYPRLYKAAFGDPTEAQREAFRNWVAAQEDKQTNRSVYQYTLNGSSAAPEVILLQDGRLHIQGTADRNVIGELVLLADQTTTSIDIPASGAFEHTIQLPAEGVYHLLLGSFNTIVVYDAP